MTAAAQYLGWSAKDHWHDGCISLLGPVKCAWMSHPVKFGGRIRYSELGHVIGSGRGHVASVPTSKVIASI